MDKSGQLSALIGNIYDAVLDSSLWGDVLHQIAHFVGGPGASLYSKDAASKTADIAYQFGIEPRYVQLYSDKYIKLDPTSTAFLFVEIGEPVATADLMSYGEFLETRFYKEWAQPQGLVDSANAVLERSATAIAALVVFRHARDGLIDDEARRRMRLIVPHIRRAVLIGRVIDLKTAETASLADTFDGIAAGMFLVDANGHIMHANAAGHAMLAAGDFLRAVGSQLATNDPEADRALRDVFMAASEGDGAVGTGGLSVPLMARDGERHAAHVLPLTSGARRGASGAYKAAAAMFVHKAALDTTLPLEIIAKSYRLTPTELRVLLAIVEVGGVSEVAEALGIADTTVKTHLGRLYEKTAARRHADLVKLVAGYTNPLIA